LKETVYVETSIISYLTARPSNDLRAMANQNTTTEWWEIRKLNYTVVASDLVISEAAEVIQKPRSVGWPPSRTFPYFKSPKVSEHWRRR
jgi:hypothetical protein